MKKGFTLIELLAVIIIIGVLAVLILPGLIENYEKSLVKIMETSESEINDGAELALTDYCNKPISATTKKQCLYSDTNTNGLVKSLGSTYYICLSKLQDLGYYENKVEYEKKECPAFVIIEKDADGKYGNAKTYIYCGNDYDYDYATDEELPNLRDYLEGCGYE